MNEVIASLQGIVNILNENQGVLTVFLFILSLVIGWLSGIFDALRRRPKLLLSLLDGPTFCCTFLTGKKYGDFDGHRTGIALYLHVKNLGSAATDLESIEIGYHCSLRPISLLWLRYGLGRFWIRHQSVALEDFQVSIGRSIKVYPFLTQHNNLATNYRKHIFVLGSRRAVLYTLNSGKVGVDFSRVEMVLL